MRGSRVGFVLGQKKKSSHREGIPVGGGSKFLVVGVGASDRGLQYVGVDYGRWSSGMSVDTLAVAI